MTLDKYQVKDRKKKGVRVSSDHDGSYSVWEREELHQAIRYWYAQGFSDLQVAMHAGCSDQTVLRYRKRNSLAPNYPSSKGN